MNIDYHDSLLGMCWFLCRTMMQRSIGNVVARGLQKWKDEEISVLYRIYGIDAVQHRDLKVKIGF